ncbi:MAG: cupin domain-containing protein [Planctomycetaceae bacterium]|nr:MAG: cupin domain-containing protein [Planctomycetaceae bacterium]
MAEPPPTIRLRTHENYARLSQLADESHARGRAPQGIQDRDIALARLYSHAFRGHVIGAFHATRLALSQVEHGDPLVSVHLLRASETLTALANRSMDDVGTDARALIATFHHYSTHVARTLNALESACSLTRQADLVRIHELFLCQMQAITAENGIHLTRDTSPPEQGSFVVPSLGITIVPLVYGDHHSWNLAWLPAEKADVPYHLHQEGVEIHLGYGPMHGYTVLGDAKAELVEGYAMPIPPRTRHGYTNIGSLPHHVPFIFGSLTCGGWGVFLDVEPQPRELDLLQTSPVMGPKLNGTIALEREIDRAAMKFAAVRYPLIPASATDRYGVGGLELSIARVTERGLTWRLERFCAVSVVRGKGVVSIAGEDQPLSPRDHFGIPAGLPAVVRQVGSEPLVLLDAVLRPAQSPR